MIQVIKSGKKPKKMKGTCQNCGCKVQCDRADTRTLVDRDTHVNTATQFVQCPECKHSHLWVR